MLEKFEQFIQEHDAKYNKETLIEISKNVEEDYYFFTFYGEFAGQTMPKERRYTYNKETDSFDMIVKKTEVQFKSLDPTAEQTYQFKGKEDPEFQKVLRWKTRLTNLEYLMLRANADYSYSTKFLEEIEKEALVIKEATEFEIETNPIQYPSIYNALTDSFVYKIASYDPTNVEVEHGGEKLITGMFVIEEIEGLPSQISNENLMFLEGACNLYLNGINAFTPEVLYRFSIGRPDARVTEQQKQRAIKSVERLDSIRQELDLTPYIQKYGNKEAKEYIEDGGVFIINSRMLNVDWYYGKVQGVRHSQQYRLNKAPALLEYNKWLANKRIGQIDKALLDVLSTSVEDSLIKRELARRLIALENPNNNISNNVINFETLYSRIDLENPSKKKRQSIREKVYAVLDYWKAIGRINGYDKNVKKGRTFTGVKIDYIKRSKAIS